MPAPRPLVKGEVPAEERIELAIVKYDHLLALWEASHTKSAKNKPSMRHIAKQHGLVHTTLMRRYKGITKAHCEAHKHRQLLTPEEELALERLMIQLDAWGWPARVYQLRALAKILLVEHGRSPDLLGANWVQKFLKRHPVLRSVFAQALDKERALMHDKDKLKAWFELFQAKCEEYGIELEDIYNMDEKGFALGLIRAIRVVTCTKKDRNASTFLTQCGNREWASLIECISADGRKLEPWIIFKGKMQQKQWHDHLSEGGQGGHIAISDKGWTDNEIGLEWFKQCFESETRRCKLGKYRLLLLDGHSSHLTSDAINFCIDNDIILLCLPAHATDTLQPLDVGVFLSLSQAYRLELESFNRLGFGYTIDKVDFIDLYLSAREKAMTSLTSISSWAKTGLVPFDLDIVLDNVPEFELEKEADGDETAEKPRLSTPPGLSLVSSNGDSVFISFTPSASGAHVDRIVKYVNEHPTEENTKPSNLSPVYAGPVCRHRTSIVSGR